MWGFAFKHGYKNGAILEPSCGIGKFLANAPNNTRIEGYETNKYSSQIANILYPTATIHNKSFENLFFNGNVYLKGQFRTEPFDLVIGNPPYGSFSGKYAGMGEKKRTKAFTYDQYFLTRGLDVLNENGLLIMVIPQSFLDNDAKYNPLKEKIAEKAELIEARRLPHGIFQHTEVGTDIVVFRKITSNEK
jgi:type I restriction-modification system DNA methylase subunit